MTATNVRVCPSCGVAAGDADTCEGCGLELARLAELPTRAD
jgi:methionyl-tRNA synthetase